MLGIKNTCRGLITVLETFASYGSTVSDASPVSLWAAQRRRRLQVLMVYLVVTFGVKQQQLVVGIRFFE